MRRMCGSRKFIAFTFCSALAPGNIWRARSIRKSAWLRAPLTACDVGVHASLADVAVGVQPAVEGHDLDVESFFGEESNGLLSGIVAGSVRIEVGNNWGARPGIDVCRLRIATCCSVKAVPLVAITF